MSTKKGGSQPAGDDAGDVDRDRIGKDPSKLPGGRAGGAASAARPAEDRKASAKKAAETRKRNQVTGPQDYTQEANKSALQIQRDPGAAEELAEQIEAGDEEGLHAQALVEKADEDFVLEDGGNVDPDDDATTVEENESPDEFGEGPLEGPLDAADVEEDVTDKEEAGLEEDEPLQVGDEDLDDADVLLEEADAAEEDDDDYEDVPKKTAARGKGGKAGKSGKKIPAKAADTRSKTAKGGKKAPAKKSGGKAAAATNKADTGKGTGSATRNAAKRKAAGKKPAGRKRARREA